MALIKYEDYQERKLTEIIQLQEATKLCIQSQDYDLIPQIQGEIKHKYNQLFIAYDQTIYCDRVMNRVYNCLRRE